MKIIKEDRMASDDCSFCGTHATCGHYFRAVKEILNGYEDERGSYILVNTCGDYSWICADCWSVIKYILIDKANKIKGNNKTFCGTYSKKVKKLN